MMFNYIQNITCKESESVDEMMIWTGTEEWDKNCTKFGYFQYLLLNEMCRLSFFERLLFTYQVLMQFHSKEYCIYFGAENTVCLSGKILVYF